MFGFKFVKGLCLTAMALVTASSHVKAELVNPPADPSHMFPLIFFQDNVGVAYDAATQSFTVNADDFGGIFYITAPTSVVTIDPPQSVKVSIQVDAAGIGTSLGSTDLVVEGKIDTDGNPGYEYDGVLLTGKLFDFGFNDETPGSAPGTDAFDAVFDVTGGLLAPFWANGQIALRVTSEASTFGGSFTGNFAGEAKGDLTFTPCVPTKLTGKVSCPGGAPVENALVEIFNGGTEVGESATAADGTYTITGLTAGTYTVKVTPPAGYKSCDDAVKTLTVLCNRDSKLDFCVCPCRPSLIKGQILCTTGGTVVGISGIEVTVKEKSTGNVVATATSGADGSYTAAPALGINTYVVSVAVPSGYQLCGPDTQEVTLECEKDGVINFCVCPCPLKPITGKVVCKTATATTPRANITVTAYDAANVVVGSAVTAGDGTYSIPNLGPGTYTVKVTVPPNNEACSDTSKMVTLVCGQGGTADFCICAPVVVCKTTIKGKVKCPTSYTSSTPVAGATVTVYNQANAVVAVKTTAADGTYSVLDLPPGTYNVKLTGLPEGYVACSYTTVCITIKCNETKTADFCACPCPPGTVTGKVKCETNGQAISGVTVKAYKGSTLAGSATTNSSGVYTIANLPPGTYTIKITVSSGYKLCCDDSVCTTLTCGDTDTVDFCLCPPCEKGKIEGKVKCTSTGKAIDKVTVKAYKGSTLVSSATTNSDGYYCIANLPTGDYTVKLSVPSGYQSCSNTTVCTTLTCGDTDTVDFCLCPSCPPGCVSGKVYCGSTNKNMSGMTVKLYKGTTLVKTATTDSYGKYSFCDLGTGSYTVKVYIKSGTKACTDSAICFTLSCGQSKTVNFCVCPNTSKCW